MALIAAPTALPQAVLGDKESAEARSIALREEAASKMATIGAFKPKDALQFVRNITYKNVVGVSALPDRPRVGLCGGDWGSGVGFVR